MCEGRHTGRWSHRDREGAAIRNWDEQMICPKDKGKLKSGTTVKTSEKAEELGITDHTRHETCSQKLNRNTSTSLVIPHPQGRH